MGHSLTKLHEGPHLYGPGGIGARDYDPTVHLLAEEIEETRDLPGFVDDYRPGVQVTYESHHFWIHFCRASNRGEIVATTDSSVLIRVHHGGGWRVWRGDYMLARALRRYGDDDRGLFLLCWYLIETAESAERLGRIEAANEYRVAFVDGRLKKRKLPARGGYKIWIEPQSVTA